MFYFFKPGLTGKRVAYWYNFVLLLFVAEHIVSASRLLS